MTGILLMDRKGEDTEKKAHEDGGRGWSPATGLGTPRTASSHQKLQVRPGTDSPSERPEGVSLWTPRFGTSGLVLVHAAITSYHRVGGFTDGNAFSHSPGSWTHEVRMPAWPGFGEGPLPHTRTTAFALGPHRAASGEESKHFSFRSSTPIVRL